MNAVEREAVSLIASDGILLAGEVVAAQGERRGTLLFVHGFGGDKYENGLFDALAERAAAQGLASITYDWRGRGESYGLFPWSTMDQHVSDFCTVQRWTKDRFPGRLCVVGFSLGAAVVGLAMRRGELPDQAVYLAPAVRPNLSMWPRYNTPEIQNELDKHGLAQKPGSDALLGRPILESALRDTDLGPDGFDVPVPLLVCHGIKDSRIAYTDSRELAERVAEKPDFQYVEFPEAGHSFRREPQRRQNFWPQLADKIIDWATRPDLAG